MLTALLILGATLFGLGAASEHIARQAEQDFPATGNFITAGGIRQHVIERGDGPALVMIHGAYGAAADFEASLMPQTARQFRSIAVDRPGHGYSDAIDSDTPDAQARMLHAALETLGVRRPVLLGFSYGGAVALSYALQYPDAVAALVLVSPATHPWRRSEPLPFGIADAPLVGPLLKHTIVTPAGMLLKDSAVASIFAPSAVPQSFAGAPVALGLRPDDYAATAREIRVLDAFLRQQVPQYPGLRMPVAIVVNDADTSVWSTVHGRPLASVLRDVKLMATDGGGHPLHFSRPASVLAAIDWAAAKSGY
ncbi:alpha/beta hydrolase [Ferrovibrio terrae]|uniref:Alpha/beta hydrolase n=1 Tax=Ferrovibrio terrae TaxID=2594003 RepID=A0A516GWU7_9PROT|nr:alpha/beta hydrolase [Ferrovibrio terrae]QDO95994.1 alpha/beta hydrolase [Ferrovibrio terrae]